MNEGHQPLADRGGGGGGGGGGSGFFSQGGGMPPDPLSYNMSDVNPHLTQCEPPPYSM